MVSLGRHSVAAISSVGVWRLLLVLLEHTRLSRLAWLHVVLHLLLRLPVSVHRLLRLLHLLGRHAIALRLLLRLAIAIAISVLLLGLCGTSAWVTSWRLSSLTKDVVLLNVSSHFVVLDTLLKFNQDVIQFGVKLIALLKHVRKLALN